MDIRDIIEANPNVEFELPPCKISKSFCMVVFKDDTQKSGRSIYVWHAAHDLHIVGPWPTRRFATIKKHLIAAVEHAESAI